MDQSELGCLEPRKPAPVSDPARTAALSLLQTLEQVRKQLERRLDWCALEPRVTRLVARAEAGAKLLSPPGEGDCDATSSWSGALVETLTEVNVSAAVAAEAGQWRWAWSTDAVSIKLRRMRADLKRAFAAIDAAPPAAIDSIQVAEERTLAPSTPTQTAPRRSFLQRIDDDVAGETAAGQAVADEWGDAGAPAEDAVSTPILVTSSFPQGTVAELASGLRLRPIRLGRVSLEP